MDIKPAMLYFRSKNKCDSESEDIFSCTINVHHQYFLAAQKPSPKVGWCFTKETKLMKISEAVHVLHQRDIKNVKSYGPKGETS